MRRNHGKLTDEIEIFRRELIKSQAADIKIESPIRAHTKIILWFRTYYPVR
jgi:hypothetical protein